MTAPLPQTTGLALVVEDDELCARMIQRVLRAESIDCARAADGIEAIEYIRAHRGGVSVIVLDLSMPRMSGLDFLSLRRGDPELSQIPVILTSAQTDITFVSDEDVADRFTKPFQLKALVQAVRRLGGV